MNLDTPEAYYGRPFCWGSGAVRDWLAAEPLGDFTDWQLAHVGQRLLDVSRRCGLIVKDEHKAWERDVDHTRRKSTAWMRKGSLIEVMLWTPADPLEWAHAEEDATAGELQDAADAVVRLRKCSEVQALLAQQRKGCLEAQVGRATILEGVEVKSREDLVFHTEDHRVSCDFKVWADWPRRDVERIIQDGRYDVQAALYQMIAEHFEPDTNHANALLVVNPWIKGATVPRSLWYEFPEEMIECAKDDVRRALKGIRELMTPTEVAA